VIDPHHVESGSRESAQRRGSSGLGKAAELLLPVIPFSIAAGLALMVESVAGGETHRVAWPWVPSLGVNLSFQLDGLSLLFSLLITGIGGVIFLYAPGYFEEHPARWRLYGWLLLFMAAMLGLVLADNLLTLFICWELTSVTSYMLIGFKHESEKARLAALQALLVTGLGGLALLAGLLLLAQIADSYELTTILARADVLSGHPLLTASVILILLGALTKSAQFPFHFWLPAAMEAPTPVSAYLHSATMVKAGVYLVARLSPAFGGIAVWDYAIAACGTLTALVGGLYALGQTDLKRMLAYSTVSALGLLMLLLAQGTPLAVKAALVFLLCHALFKAALFLVAGAVDHSTGTRDVRALGGLAAGMPLLAVAAVLAGCSKAGLPPAGGFLAKELVYESALHFSGWWLPIVIATFIVNAASVGVAGLVAVGPFFARRQVAATRPKWQLTLAPLLLGVSGFAIGLWPGWFGTYAVGPAVAAIDRDATIGTLKLWHGFNLPLLLSAMTIVAGGVLYRSANVRSRLSAGSAPLAARGPTAVYEGALGGLKWLAAEQTRILQNGRLRVYLLVVLISFAGLVGFELADHIELPRGGSWLDIQLYELFIPALILSAILLIVTTTSRLAAVCALGVIGYAVAMLFVLFAAPDLAMTQLAIETLTVILFVFVIYRLPKFGVLSPKSARLRDAVVAIAAGSVMTAVALAATLAHAPSRLAPFFAANSLIEAKGRNMVNVILVDFRALDTLGEITVLAVAALGIFALMRLRTTSSTDATSDATKSTNEGASVARGPDRPGGGQDDRGSPVSSQATDNDAEMPSADARRDNEQTQRRFPGREG